MAKSEKNYGVSLLKTMMCFEVLACHFLPYNDALIWQQPIHMLKTSAVPVFMLLSFLPCRGRQSGSAEKAAQAAPLAPHQLGFGVLRWLFASELYQRRGVYRHGLLDLAACNRQQ